MYDQSSKAILIGAPACDSRGLRADAKRPDDKVYLGWGQVISEGHRFQEIIVECSFRTVCRSIGAMKPYR